MRDAGKARLRAHRPVLAVRGDADQDRATIELLQLVIAEAPFFQRTWTEILDDDVAFRGELAQQIAPAFAGQIERDAFLVACFRQPHQRVAAFGVGPEPAQRVAGAGRLDLDHLGAELAQNGGAMRAGDESAEIEDADSLERSHAGCLSLSDALEQAHQPGVLKLRLKPATAADSVSRATARRSSSPARGEAQFTVACRLARG